jgi:predicted outer membrane repeat protein
MIQDAIDASANGDTTIVRPGTYFENIDFLGKAIIVKSEEGPDATVVENQLWFGSVVTFRNGEGVDSVLDGFKLTNGTGTLFPYWYIVGGGILCMFDSSPTIMNTLITGNTAEMGAGIFCGYDSSPIIMNTTISGNVGGGISCIYFSSPTIMNTTITSNLGGIYCDWYSPPTITNTTISENMGGICCSSDSSPIIMNTLITGNTSDYCGGGVYCDNSDSPAIIINTTIVGNTAYEYGGGIYCLGTSPIIMNTLITGNTSDYCGGGIYCYGSDSSAIIMNTTIAGNTSCEHGGGIYCNDSLLTLSNTILWNNSAATGPEIYLDYYDKPSTVTISYSDVKGGQACVYVEPGYILDWGEGMIDSDPLFVDAATDDFHLTFNSPCRGSGDNAIVTELYDFEGDPRICQGTVDMGADEFHDHLYCTGDFTPNGSIEGKFIGLPGTWPVGLFIGSGVLDPPMQHKWGEFYLKTPWLLFPLVPIPAKGVLEIPATLPGTSSPYDIPMQALIGWELTNLFVLEIQ